MKSRDFKPPEEKTSPVFFFILGLLMVAVTFWTVWDETFTRRPWKTYQKNFNEFETARLNKELSEARAKSGDALAKIDADISALQKKLAEDKELAALKEELDRKELDTFEKVQDFGFGKAYLDEAYFHLQEGIRRGKNVTGEREHFEEAKKEVDRLKPISDAAKKSLNETKAKITEKEKLLIDLQLQRRSIGEKNLDLERRLTAIRSRPYEIKQIVIKEFERNNFGEPLMRVDRCQSCHLSIDRVGFEDAPQPFRTHPDREVFLKKHDTNKIGCTSCHGGQGTAITSVDKAHGYVTFWEDPLLKGSEIQTKCVSCHAETFNIPKAAHVSRGISLIRELGCWGCHNIPNMGNLRKRGPDLSRIKEKVNKGWLVSWIKRPKDYNPRTKMPFFSLSDQEAADIASYLWAASRRLAPKEEIEGLDSPDKIEKGKELFESVGCLGCHIRTDSDIVGEKAIEGVDGSPIVIRNRDFAPALGKIGTKVQADWLVRWLKNPKSYWHDTTMPGLRLSDEEVQSIAAHLLSLARNKPGPASSISLDDSAAFARGKTLLAKRGCVGCHVVPGVGDAKIGPDLAAFAVKKTFELSFGNVVNTPHNWEAWTFGKIKNPKIYQTGRETLLMPNFDLSDEETVAIRTFLRAMVPHGPPHSAHKALDEKYARIEQGRRMIEKYNCTGCHVVENWGGNLLARYEDINNGPPSLNGEGEKIQPDWFFSFLQNVTPLRPWLKVRMPSFQMPAKDAATLVDYFAALDDKLQPYVHFDAKKVSPETIAAAEDIFHKADCLSCHGEFPPPAGKEAPTAPNLLFAKSRLRPDWIFRWIVNPSEIRPGTKMPVFFEGAGFLASVKKGTFLEKEDDRWLYELETKEEADLPEEQLATLRLGNRSFLVRVEEIDENKVKISAPEDLGKTFGISEIESHGEPVDEELLDGDAYKQIRALRDFLMVSDAFPAVAEEAEEEKSKPDAPQTKAPSVSTKG